MKNISIKIDLPLSSVNTLFDLSYEHGATVEDLIKTLVVNAIEESYSEEEDLVILNKAFEVLDQKRDKISFAQWLLGAGLIDDALDNLQDIKNSSSDLEFYGLFPEKDPSGSEVKAVKLLIAEAKDSLNKLYSDYKDVCTGPVESFAEAFKSLIHYSRERVKALDL